MYTSRTDITKKKKKIWNSTTNTTLNHLSYLQQSRFTVYYDHQIPKNIQVLSIIPAMNLEINLHKCEEKAAHNCRSTKYNLTTIMIAREEQATINQSLLVKFGKITDKNTVVQYMSVIIQIKVTK